MKVNCIIYTKYRLYIYRVVYLVYYCFAFLFALNTGHKSKGAGGGNIIWLYNFIKYMGLHQIERNNKSWQVGFFFNLYIQFISECIQIERHNKSWQVFFLKSIFNYIYIWVYSLYKPWIGIQESSGKSIQYS